MRFLTLLFTLSLVGCAATYPVPEVGTAFDLDRCPPFLNCVSSESTLFLYKVAPIQLAEPLNTASWEKVQTIATELPCESTTESRFGYLRATCYSNVIKFPDYLEILVSGDGTELDIRSQSQFGLFDFNVNRNRVELLRGKLLESGMTE